MNEIYCAILDYCFFDDQRYKIMYNGIDINKAINSLSIKKILKTIEKDACTDCYCHNIRIEVYKDGKLIKEINESEIKEIKGK